MMCSRHPLPQDKGCRRPFRIGSPSRPVRSRKGMASMIDAFMFITVIGLVAAGMFAYSFDTAERETVAKAAYDTFFDIRLRTDDMFGDTDSRPARICDLIAAYMMTGEGNIPGYIENIMYSVIPPVYGYLFVFEYNDRVLTIGEERDEISSRHSSSVTISDGSVMHASLSVY